MSIQPRRRGSSCAAVGRRASLRHPGRSRKGQDGQSLVEFSLILAPLLLLLLGVVQFGFIFNSYITLSTAAREAARDASIYLYDTTLTKTQNDTVRNTRAMTTLLGSLNGLSKTAPNFSTGGSWTTSTVGTTITATNGDLQITYTLPSTVTDNDPRQGWRISVKATYHQDIIIPFIDVFLPHDGTGRMPLQGEVTMVLN